MDVKWAYNFMNLHIRGFQCL